jgi:hypothetical protein
LREVFGEIEDPTWTGGGEGELDISTSGVARPVFAPRPHGSEVRQLNANTQYLAQGSF